ncbi:hypothetical protein GQ55_2G317600 [Panicum hallii var. hallii]|uniref:Uncharacterized protein n=1 Tax=Panicum hallii var. hallii TaxID=1504633 RepID=A0A2T7EUJ5_9POAL|nr:hypothetical protein GQ55_2G317600 [Panicum hallii var. hallii]
MPGLEHKNSFVNLLDKQLHKLSTSKMRISKSAPNLLKKAATSVKSKTDALRTKLVFVASLRRRLAMVCAMSRQIHALSKLNGQAEKQARVEHGGKALITTHKAATAAGEEPAAGDHGGRAPLGMFEVAVFEEAYHGYPDWTSSFFDDDHCYNDEEDGVHDDDDDREELDVVDALDGPSVIEIIKSNREAQGLEFNMDDEIDEACDMFIRRCRSQMNLSLY